MRETLFRGGSACIPAVPREGLSESLVDPAVAWLQARGCLVITGRRVAALRIGGWPGERAGHHRWSHAGRGGGACRPALGRCRPAAWPALSDRVPGDPQHPLPGRGGSAARPDSSAWSAGPRNGCSSSAGTSRSRSARPIGWWSRTPRRSRAPSGRTCRRRWTCEGQMPAWRVVKERRATVAATAEQERLRPGAAHGARQSGARRRLDRHRVARHDRRCHQVRPNRGRGAARRLRTRNAG